MANLEDAVKQLEGAISRLEKAAGKASSRRPEPSVLTQTVAQVAARLDATIARLDRILED
jgi:ABC-type transporter Mla subunit MlaD